MSAPGPRLTAGAVLRALAGVLCVAAMCMSQASAPALAASPPVVQAESILNVAANSATLEAQVNPEGAQTSYRFEYGMSEAYGASVPVPAGSAGSGTGVVTVQAHPQSLQSHTVYHYRVVVTNAGGTVDGIDQQFTTQPGGGELALPDGRQWELVSPPVKDGARFLPIEESGVLQAADDGSAISYLATAATEANPAGNAVGSQEFSARGAAGWSSQDIATPHDAATGVHENGSEYQFFSADLSLGLVEPFDDNQPALSPEASERTPYLRDDRTGVYRPLVTAANVPAGRKFGSEDFGATVRFVGGTPDLSHVVLLSKSALTATPVEFGLYEWAAGQLQLISVLPESDGGGAVQGALGTASNVRYAISDDGSSVVWSEGGGENSHLFLRDTAKEETVQLDAVQGGAGGGATQPKFQIASSDGSKVFFTDTQHLTEDSTASNGQDLYEFSVNGAVGKLSGTLSDLTVDENAGESAAVQGVVQGASEDGSYVYFVANGVLAPGASPGQCGGSAPGATCNLYVRHNGTTTFIAALAREDADGVANEGLAQLTARVSPNGRYLAFMSQRSLTGYDNRDANSGMLDEEVYLYDAQAGRLVCASCNPTGARPVGVEDPSENELLATRERTWNGRWLAANIPGWTPTTPSRIFYQSRYLSDSGRLFFNSSDALVAQDTNGRIDVYEYEPAGVGGCTSASATFGAGSGGCVGLISAGTGAEESAFLDASATGDDVFFLTTSQLVRQDFDNAFDVYDAHVCSAAVPCPAQIAAPLPCTTADSCRTAPASQPAIFGAPASATFVGTGNLVPPAAKPAVRAKRPKAKAKPKQRAKSKRAGRRKRHGRGSKSTTRQSLSARTRR